MRASMIPRWSLALLIILFLDLKTRAATSFSRDIAPIFLEKCVTCHGPEKSKGDFRLDTFEALMKGGESKKAAIKPGAPNDSHLYELITTTDEDDRMPQKSDRLAEKEITALRAWINEGAKFDGSDETKSLAAIVPYLPGPEPLKAYPFPSAVLALAWSPDGKQLASSGQHEVLIWNEEGKLKERISRLPERIRALTFAGDWLAISAGRAGKSGELLLCHPGSTETPRLLLRLSDEVTALAVNPKQTLLAAGGSDNAIHSFEIPSGKELFVAQQHADWVTALAFSPDGSRLVSGSRDRTARIFDSANGALLETYPDHVQAVYAVAFSADGKRAFSGGKEKKVHAWNASDGKKAGEFPSLDGDVLAISLLGKNLFVSGGENKIHIFDTSDRKEIGVLKGHTDWIYTLALDANGKRLASGSYNGEIAIWDIEKRELLRLFKAAP